MRTLTQIQQYIAELIDEAESIAALAEQEKRELSAEEQQRVDEILTEKTGLVAKAREDERRAQRLQQIRAENAARREGRENRESAGSTGETPRIVIPAKARRWRSQYFRGNDRDERAYAFGRWALGLFGHKASAEWAINHGFEYRDALQEGLDTKGGSIVPEEFEATIIDLKNDYGIARRTFRRIPMMSDTKVQPRRTGGLTAYAISEATSNANSATITASDKAWDRVRLTAKMWGVLTYFSGELNEDAAVTLGDDLASEIAYALAYAEDNSAFNGDGTSTYNGIVGLKNALAAGATFTARTGNTAFSTLDLEDFEDMAAKLPSYAYKDGGPEWFIHRAGWWSSMRRLTAAAGGNTQRDIESGGRFNFLGFPVNLVEVMNSTLSAQTSTSGLVYFGNPRQSVMFGDRSGLAVAVDSSIGFAANQLAIRGIERFDINVHDKGDASNAGGMIMLATPGS